MEGTFQEANMPAMVEAIATPIERRAKISYEQFAQEYLYPHKPVILTGALEAWRALSAWTPDMFREKYGSMKVTIDGQEYSMSDFIGRVESSTDSHPAPYLRNAIIEHFLPELLADISPLPDYFSPNWLDGPFSKMLHSRLHRGSAELYIGGEGGK